MFSLTKDKRGVILIVVMGTIAVIVVLANVVLRIMTSQASLTQHQVSRIQAYYASMAGVNYALEKLRLGQWSAGLYSICNSGGCDVSDPEFPSPTSNVTRIDIRITSRGNPTYCPSSSVPADIHFCVQATAVYNRPNI